MPARALATVDPAECGLVAARARRALGVAALADGSYLQAFTQLRGLFSEDGTPLHNYASYLGVADLAAAAVRADRRMEGCDVIEHALSRLDGTASARLEQLIARARGILAGPARAEAHFGKALADPAGDQWPFERAQLRLDYAEWLRRRRRINDAKPVLTEALGTFRRLGARSWAQRAQAELRACGVAVTGAPGEPRCPRGADPPAAPDRPPGQRRPDRPRDRRPALPLTAHGQLAPVPVLSQARGSQPPPATRRDRPHQHASHSTRKHRKRDPSISLFNSFPSTRQARTSATPKPGTSVTTATSWLPGFAPLKGRTQPRQGVQHGSTATCLDSGGTGRYLQGR